MSKTRTQFSSPIGRLVQGDAWVAQTKDQQGALRVVKSGPNAGQPAPQFFLAVAIEKTNPDWPAFMALLHSVASTEWPHLFPATSPAQPVFGIMAIPPANPLFTFKVKDGDGLDRNDKSNAGKDGFAGCWIVSFASSYAPKVVKETVAGSNTWETMTDPNALKRGYYVQIAGTVSSNDSANTPGIYVNLDLVAIKGHGPEIVGGMDAGTAFGGGAAPAYVPAGASAIPVSTTPLPGATVPAPPVVAAVPVVPVAPVVAAVPPPPVVAAGPTMTAKAGGATYAAMVAQGWTDATLVEHGYMAPPAPAFLEVPATTGPVVSLPVVVPIAPVISAPVIPSPTRVMTAAAGGATYEAMIAGGWTDAMMIAQGYMTA